MAQLVCECVPSIESVRMVNSGTEAVMGAIRAARGFTGRDKIVKFACCYHGHMDALLVQAGSGAMTMGAPDSAGVTAHQTQDTIVCRFNDIDGTRQTLRELGDELACVAVEPLPANMGLVPAHSGFLQMLREETQKSGAVLLFDEVMTGFRLSRGGYQQLIGITPDATTLGKIIGGGFPVGAYGGSREMMHCVAPVGPVYQAGTLSGNPIAMTAGLATLRALDDAAYEYLEKLGARWGKWFARDFGRLRSERATAPRRFDVDIIFQRRSRDRLRKRQKQRRPTVRALVSRHAATRRLSATLAI